MNSWKIHTREILCAYDCYDLLKSRFPKKKISADKYIESMFFYWFNYKGKVRAMKVGSKEIYVCDYEKGFPYMKIARITKGAW